jgi:hypothetical protein
LKFYNDIEELLRPYPGRWFKMAQIIRYVAHGRSIDRKERHAIKVGVLRVLDVMREIRAIEIRPSVRRGCSAFYRWKVAHEEVAEWH